MDAIGRFAAKIYKGDKWCDFNAAEKFEARDHAPRLHDVGGGLLRSTVRYLSPGGSRVR